MKHIHLILALLMTTPLMAEEDNFRTEGVDKPEPAEEATTEETAEVKKQIFPVDWGDDYELTTEWEFSRRPWAIFVGMELPEELADDSAHRKALETSGYKILHVKKPSELPIKFRKVAPKSGLLHLSWHDGSHKERIKPEELTAEKLKDFSASVLKKSKKSYKRRLERLSRRINHCYQVAQMVTVSDKVKIKRIEELKAFAERELIAGLPEVINRLEVEIDDRNTQVTVRPTVVQLDELRVIPVNADGIAGSQGIELPGMTNRSIRTTVMAP